LNILERNETAEWLGGKEFYDQFELNLHAMQVTGTTDGEELAELTDEDAKDRPWVMGDCGSWEGPHRLLSGPPVTRDYYVLWTDTTGGVLRYSRVRRATENELKQAGIRD
jgi:hypothetical protein